MGILEGKEQLEMWDMLRLRVALKLELLGMKHSRGSAYAYIKKHYGLKGNKQKVYDDLCSLIEKLSPPCAIAGCESKAKLRGLCADHYHKAAELAQEGKA